MYTILIIIITVCGVCLQGMAVCLLDVIDKACPKIVEKLLPHLPVQEKVKEGLIIYVQISSHINGFFCLFFLLFFCFVCCFFLFSRREAGGFLMSPPPVWNIRASSLIPLFSIYSLVLLPSPVAISVLSFSAFGRSPDLVSPKPPFSER